MIYQKNINFTLKDINRNIFQHSSLEIVESDERILYITLKREKTKKDRQVVGEILTVFVYS
ncbi:hypothetical protein PIPA1_21810 [Pelosinus sp. IPA-1]|nr:hypothetical protein PIPA1_21810 [Pelosinus sp. IPA-1]